MNEYPLPTASSGPTGITAGPDGNIWFTENSGNNIGRITPTGSITEFAIPTASSKPTGITTGPNGNLWFTENAANNIGQVTPGGTFTEFAIPTAASGPQAIVAGPDGNLWFIESSSAQIGRITPAGVITEFAGPSSPRGITAGPDGNLWVTDVRSDTLDRVTTSGQVTAFTVDPARPSGDVVVGPDGNLWFVDQFTGPPAIDTITTGGTGFATNSVTNTPSGLASGPNGALWFTDQANLVNEMSTAGVVTAFSTPTANSNPGAITTGPDGNMWFVESGANNIAQLQIPASCANETITPSTSATQPGFPNTGPGLQESVAVTVANCGSNALPNLTTSTTTTPPDGCGSAPAINDVSTASLPAGTSITANTTFTAPYCVGTYTVSSQTFSDATPVASATQAYVDAVGAMGIVSPTATVNGRLLNGVPGKPTTGPDGNIWYTFSTGTLFKYAPGGALTPFTLTQPGVPKVTAGPDGDIWVGVGFGYPSQIAKYGTDGSLLLLLPLPDGVTISGLAPGPDGNMWVTEDWPNGPAVERVSPDGKRKLFRNLNLTSDNTPAEIASGSDGNLWAAAGTQILRLTTSGVATTFSISSGADTIALGPDGNMWFPEPGLNKIGRITPAGDITEFATGTTSQPEAIAQGGDGNMWYGTSSAFGGFYHVGRVTMSGVATEYAVDGQRLNAPRVMGEGPDGNVWATSNAPRLAVEIATAPVLSCSPVTLTTNPPSVTGGSNETITAAVTNCASTPQLFKLATKTTPPSGCGTATTAKRNLWLAPRNGTTVASTFATPTCTGTYKVTSTLSIGATVVGKSTVTYQVN